MHGIPQLVSSTVSLFTGWYIYYDNAVRTTINIFIFSYLFVFSHRDAFFWLFVDHREDFTEL